MNSDQSLNRFGKRWKDCQDFTDAHGYGLIRRFFVCMPAAIDRFWRLKDFKYCRSFGGLMEHYPKIQGYSPLALFLPAVLLLFVIQGPTGDPRGPLSFLLYGLALAGLYAGCRYSSRKASIVWFQTAWLVIVCALVWFLARPEAREADGELYRHILVPLVLLLIAILLGLAVPLASWLFRDGADFKPSRFAELLPKVELFQIPKFPEVSGVKIGRSLVNAPMTYPFELVFLPSVVVLITPYAFNAWLHWIALAAFVINWTLFSFANIHQRFRAMLTIFSRVFFIGGQLIISLLIIALAIGRLAQFSYVATVVESARSMLAWYIWPAYFTFWFYEFWINRILSQKFVGFFGREGPLGQRPYHTDKAAKETEVNVVGRVIQVHGGSRLIAIGRHERSGHEVFQLYERMELIDRLVNRFPFTSLDEKASFQSWANDLRRNVRFYFSSLNVALAIAFVVAASVLNRLPQVPGVAVTATPPSARRVDLQRLIFEPAQNQTRDKVVLLAASGGGTRAALYTVSVLHGLSELNALDKLVLGSGVSGGSAALAYFASHRDRLLTKDKREWEKFYDAMSASFIQEVLEGASEWRVAKGIRWGKLLEESFLRHLETQAAVGDFPHLGLIFNSALAGHLHRSEDTSQPFSEWAEENRRLTRSERAGGRLIFTNLKHAEAFPSPPPQEAHKLHFVTIQSEAVPVTAAAALNANFPPVFSNAAVDVNGTDRYWVTDGGATDNRGIISILLALRHALERESTNQLPRKIYPEIHVIVAEASAATVDYSQDRGLGSKFGAPEKFASQLMEELTSEIRNSYARLANASDKVKLHYLSMPTTLRTRGGLGTHWMLPALVQLSDPNAVDPAVARYNVISADEIKNEISLLHQTNLVFTKRESPKWRWIDSTNKVAEVRGWIFNDPIHRKCWNEIETFFR